MRIKTLFLSSLVLTALLSGCNKADNETLMASQWNLVELNGVEITAEDNFFLLFGNTEPGRFNGRGDCNSMMGEYTLSANNQIEFDEIGATRAMCANQIIEDQFMEALDEADTYLLVEDQLMIYDNGMLIAVFTASAPTAL